MRRLFYGLSSAVSLAGIIVTAYLLHVKVSPFTSCGAGECQAVLNSAYGTIGGLPTSLYGLVFFVVVLCVTVLQPVVEQASQSVVMGGLFGLTVAALLASLSLSGSLCFET